LSSGLSALLIAMAFATPSVVAAQGGAGPLGAGSPAAKLGKRAEKAQPGLSPLNRVDSRIANRVQSRVRNRIDRNYDPRANATSPFRVAGEQVRRAGSSRRR
jgi:hypothetical protein